MAASLRQRRAPGPCSSGGGGCAMEVSAGGSSVVARRGSSARPGSRSAERPGGGSRPAELTGGESMAAAFPAMDPGGYEDGEDSGGSTSWAHAVVIVAVAPCR